MVDQGHGNDLACEFYAEDGLYRVIVEKPGVGLPELSPDLSGEQLVQLQDLLEECSLVIQAKPGQTTVIEMRSMSRCRHCSSESLPDTIFSTQYSEDGLIAQ